MSDKLTLIICAYKESPYLEECIKSLKKQTLKCEIYISTSTPNNMIRKLAKKYDIHLFVNKKSKGYYEDFKFAYSLAKSKYVTLCHQDDIYLKDFAEKTFNALSKAKKPLISFTNYYDYKNEQIIKGSKFLMIKRLMNFLFKFKFFQEKKIIRNIILSFGNSICSPTVSFNKELVAEPVLNCQHKTSHDWYTWIYLAKEKGEFIYINKPLILRRINELSETSLVIKDKSKYNSDLEMFKMFWPNFIAKLIIKIYSKSEKNNEIIKKEVKKEKEVKNKMIFILPFLYVICTVLGLLLYKYGTSKEFGILFQNGSLSIKINIISIAGLILYMASFIIYILLLPKYDLTTILPIVTTATSILIFTGSIFILGEPSNTIKWIGFIIMIIGIVLVNFKR